jgi:UMF1 family MFS transporter
MDSLPAEAAPSVKKRTIAAWALWDWGSAAWNAVVTTFVFATFLMSSVFVDPVLVELAKTDAAAEEQVKAVIATHNTWLGWGVAAAGVAIALIAPLLGQRADAAGRRKLWLGVNSFMVFLAIAALYFFTPENCDQDRKVIIGLIILAFGNIFFELASVNYNAMLNQISTRENRGRISGIGWGAGYLGGIVLLAILLVGFVMIEDTGWFGVTTENGENIRVAMVFAALWWLIFALPVFFAVPEKRSHEKHKTLGVVGSYKKVGRDIARLWRSDRNVLKFLIASAIFRDGLAAVFAFGGLIAAGVFGFSPTLVIVFAIVANVISGISTIAFGFLEDKVGSKAVIVWSLIGMCFAAIMVFALHGQGSVIFWVFGSILCIFVGPVQSASRSTVSQLAKPEMEGELFGLYAMTGRVVSFLAPFLYGVAISIFKSQIYGILGIMVVLLLGLILVAPLNLSPTREQEPA